MSATDLGAPTGTSNLDVEDEVVEGFLKRLMPEDAPKEPSEKEDIKDDSADAAEPKETDAPAEKPGEEEADDEAGETPEEKSDRKIADDGAYVKIKVGDEEHEVPVKDLSRLFGQEKALTQKSMEVAETRKTVDAELAKNVAVSTALLERAQARFEPYSKIDFLLASKDLSAEDYTNLKAAATAAYEDVQFLSSNLNQFAQAAQQRQHESLVTQARESLKVLSGPTDQGGIEGFSPELYDGIRKFGIEAGLAPEIVHNLVDASAIRLLHDAMLYRKGSSKVVTTRVNKTPTKVIKTKTAPDTGSTNDKGNVTKAMKKLRSSGSTDDAADAFLASWANRDSEQ